MSKCDLYRPIMSSQLVDEETPLLQAQDKQKTGRTPLPWRQFALILLLQLAEPLTSQVIAPFAPQVCLCSQLLARILISSPSSSATLVLRTVMKLKSVIM